MKSLSFSVSLPSVRAMRSLCLGAVVVGFAFQASGASAQENPPRLGSDARATPLNNNTRRRLFDEPMLNANAVDAPTPRSPSDMPEPATPVLDRSPSPSSGATAGGMTLRQQRAIYRDMQRVRRIETQAWMGVHPLRPRWNSVPTMSSRYAPPTIYIPVYHIR